MSPLADPSPAAEVTVGLVETQPAPPVEQALGATATRTGRPPAPDWRKRYVLAVMGADGVAMALGWMIAELVVLRSFGVEEAGPGALRYQAIGAGAVLAWVGTIAIVGGYDRRVVGVSTDEYRRIGNAAIRMVALIAVIALVTELRLSRGFLTVAIPLGALITITLRHVLRVWMHRQRVRGRFTKPVVVVGSGVSTSALVDHLLGSPVAEMQVVGACIPPEHAAHARVLAELDVPVLGSPTDVWTAALGAGAEAIAIADTATLSVTAVQEMAWHLDDQGIEVMVVPAVTDVAGPRIKVQVAAGLPLLYLDEPHLSQVGRYVKAAFDRVGALVALIVLFPLLAAIGIVVRLSSPGPALFGQTRVGIDGREFRMWKFRTMVVDAEDRLAGVVHLNEHDGLLFKVRDDPRVTRVGRSLRKWSLDELPQLWNVLFGQMSIVGPRPPLSSEVERYDVRERRRLRVKPGLTGLWQVSGRSDLPWEEGLRLDLNYIDRWSLWTDIVIVAKTAKAVAMRRGAC